MTSFLSQTVSDMKMRPKTLQSRLNCLNYAENHMFISFSVQKKKAYKLIFVKKKPNSINIYKWDKWDYTAAKNHDFSKILDVNLNMLVKDGKKILVMYLKGNFLRISKMASDFS